MMTCTACGHEGHDVLIRIVEVSSDRSVRIQGRAEVYVVPERYRAEPRCVDHEACEERQSERVGA